MNNKAVTAILSGLLFVFLLSSCGKANDTDGSIGTINRVTTPDTYPLQTEDTITWWVQLHALVADNYKSLNDTPFAQALREKTGVNIEFVHPPQNEEAERLELMLASDSLTDIIECDWSNEASGGITQAISNGVIIQLDDIFKKVSPNLKKILVENPDIARAIKTPDRHFAYYPMLRGDKRLATFQGWMVRTDLMEQAGIYEMPTTLGEFEELLYRFQAIGVEKPVSVNSGYLVSKDNISLMGAFGISGGFYLDDGIVKYGPYQPEFQDFIKLMAKWYADGILDQQFADNSQTRQGIDVGNGKIGAVYASGGGHFGAWLPQLFANVPTAEMKPMPYLVRNKGERPQFGQYGNLCLSYGAAITKSCKNIEIAARVLDFGYSEEGHNLYNFGIDGVSYQMDNGIPTYTAAVTDREQNGGVSIGEGISKYARASYYGPFIQDFNYIIQYYQFQAQKDALEVWSDTDAYKHVMPTMIMTKEETDEYPKIMNDIIVAQRELAIKYINGQLDANDMDAFYANLKELGIEKAIKIQQAAYDRYINQ